MGKGYVWVDIGVGSKRVSPHGNLIHLYKAFLLGFLWPIILRCLFLSL